MMFEPHDDNLGDGGLQPHEPAPAREIDVLIGRFVDGEASTEDIDRFTGLVGPRDVEALRSLLEHKREHAMLRQIVDQEVSRAEFVDLPQAQPSRHRFPAAIVRQSASYLGWAAALALALVLAFGEGPAVPARVINQDKIEPHVVGERELGIRLHPMLTHTEKLPDGRFLLTIIERRARQIYLDQFDDEWIELEWSPTPVESPPPHDL
jgi:hypothetical protein